MRRPACPLVGAALPGMAWHALSDPLLNKTLVYGRLWQSRQTVRKRRARRRNEPGQARHKRKGLSHAMKFRYRRGPA